MDARASQLVGRLNTTIQAYQTELAKQRKSDDPQPEKLMEYITQLTQFITQVKGLKVSANISQDLKVAINNTQEVFIRHRGDINTILNSMDPKKLNPRLKKFNEIKKEILGKILTALWEINDKETLQKMIGNSPPYKW